MTINQTLIPIQTAPIDAPVRLRATTPAELVALVPCLFGFNPSNSIIVLAFKNKQLVMTGRVDADIISDVQQFRDRLDSIATQGDVVFFIAWMDDILMAERAIKLAGTLLSHVNERIIVSKGMCRGRVGPWMPCVTPPRQAGLSGLRILPSREAVASQIIGPPDDDPAANRRWNIALNRVRRQDDTGRLERLNHLLSLGLVKASKLTITQKSELAALAYVGAVRDQIWQYLNDQTARQHVELWKSVVVTVAEAGSCAPLGLLAMAAWLDGQGALLNCSIQRGLTIDPEHSLLKLVQIIIDNVLPPTAWPQMRSTLLGDALDNDAESLTVLGNH